ncbi:MAG TPA: hypothetical protein VJH68_01650 [Candidatus Nanoarchaeia archaeon]|nr:hypothetical protein [Candidatus Nanoarchaeia archaeon]
MEKMKPATRKWWWYIEHYNSKLLPPALVILLFVILFELFVHVENKLLLTAVHLLDIFVIVIFIIDLVFLAIKTKNAQLFLKRYWLDILAVFPFVFAFRLFNVAYRSIFVTEQLAISQAVFHETLEVGKEVSREARIVREGTEAGRFVRTSRVVARAARFVAKSRLFKKLNGTGQKK